ncbi:hypothetical protein SAMN04515671_1105 [Nakamurella panacisegetis]|uniref:Uncharacterized protein n=1 Tax=Nakamurella panacisegetis TaxID=1090615 RepID=A0A1H0JZM3_9ACTN|nr:hypothetical protein [Nakamurella panacisegetis]SDO49060.1 hypothetical protein SAMN04515671_1105 [Nakamurella panacisegetis]
MGWSTRAAKPDRTRVVELCPGLLYPVGWDLTGAVESTPPILWSGRIEFNEQVGRYELRWLKVDAETGATVTGEVLRSIPVSQLIMQVVKPIDQKPMAGPYALTSELQARMREAGPVTETLQMVAWIYRVAFATGDSPTKRVATSFDIPRPTADRWVRTARDRGLLGDEPGPGKASV